MHRVVTRLVRVNEIMKVLIQQVIVLETMTPMDFLEFRDLVHTATGFQSFQFRLLENKLGLRPQDRLAFNSQPYYASLTPERANEVRLTENSPSLFQCVDNWLARTPFLDMSGFDFWEQYKKATHKMFQEDEALIDGNAILNDEDKKRLLQNVQNSRENFGSLFDEKKYNELKGQGQWRLSYRAVHAGLLIQLYREQPIFQLPFRLISEVLTLDSQLTQWRYRHTLMAKRMIGSRVGSGGSSGAKYLRDATEQHKIFEDFYKLTTFFIPRKRLPDLPDDFEAKLGFAFRKG